MTAQHRGFGRWLTPSTGNMTRPVAASAMGKSTNTGRLSAVIASTTPSHANARGGQSCTARTAIHIDTLNSNVVHTSVMTSAPKYGMGGYRAVSAAAAIATRSPLTRRAMRYTTRQISTKSPVCASATGIWCTPKTR